MAKLNFVIDAQYQASNAFHKARGDIDSLDKKSGKTTKRGGGLFNLGQMLSKGLVAGAAAAGAALSGLATAVASSVGEAADLEAQMSAIAAVMGKTKAEVAPLQDLILKLGLDPSLKVNATEAANAIELLARNGLGMTEILNGAAKATVLLANSTGADFGTAADIATDAMSLWNIEAGDMIDVVNGITGVTNNSKFSIDDYALALGNGAKGAVAANLSFDQFNTMLAATASNFTSGMTAGTGMTAMLLGLGPRTEKAKGLMWDLGIITEKTGNRFFDANGEVRSNAELSEVLRDTLGKLSTQQRVSAVDTLFGRDAMAAVNGMIANTTESWEGYDNALKNTDASASAATRTDNLRGTLEILSGVVETVRLKIGSAFIPVVREMAQVFTEFIERNADRVLRFFEVLASDLQALSRWLIAVSEDGDVLNDWLTHMSPPLRTVMRGIADLVLFLEDLWGWARDLLKPITDLIAKFVSWKDVLIAAGVVIGGVVINALAGFAVAMAPIVIGIAQLIAWAALLRNAWEADFLGIRTAISAFVYEFGDSFGRAIGEIINFVRTGKEEWTFFHTFLWQSGEVIKTICGNLVTVVGNKLKEWGDKIIWAKDTGNEFVDNLRVNFGVLVEMLGNRLGAALAEIIHFVKTGEANFENLGAVLTGFKNVIFWAFGEVVRITREKLGEWWAAISDWVTENLPTWTAKMTEWANAAWGWITEIAIPKVKEKLGELVAAIATEVTNGFPIVKEKFSQWGSAAWSWIDGNTIVTKLGEWRDGILNWIVNDSPDFATATLGWATNFVSWISDAIPKAIENFSAFITGFLDSLRNGDGKERLRGGIAEWGPVLIEWISDAATKIGPALGNFVLELLKVMPNIALTMAQAGIDIAGALIAAVADAFFPGSGDVVIKITDWISGAIQSLKDVINDPSKLLQAGKDMLAKIGDGIRQGWNTPLGTIDLFMDSMIDKWNLKVDPLLNHLRSHGSSMLGRIRDGITHALNDPSAAIGTWSELFTNVVNTRIDPLLTHVFWIGAGFLQRIRDGINHAFNDPANKIAEAINNMWSTLDTWFGFRNLFDIGKNVMHSLADGIWEGMKKLSDTWELVVNYIPGWMKDILGIASPSKVMMAIGENVMQGLALGLDRTSDLPQLAIQSAATGLLSPFGALGNQVSNSTTNNSTSNSFAINFAGSANQDSPDETRRLLSTLNAAVEVP